MRATLSRRELAAIHLLMQYIEQEANRLGALDQENAWRFANPPSFKTLWSEDSDAGLNGFFREHGNFDRQIKPPQVARVIKALRQNALVYNVEDPEERPMLGNEWALIPKPEMEKLHEELMYMYGNDPTRWPDTVPYDPKQGRALWKEAVL